MRTFLAFAACALGMAVATVAQGQGPATMPADHPPFASTPARRSSALDPQTVMARVDDKVITAGDVDAVVYAPGTPDRLEYLTPDGLRELVDALVDRKLMAAAARAAGMGAPTAQAPAPSDLALADAWLSREMSGIAPPTPQAIERYYRENAAQFTVPARVRVTRVIARSEEAAGRLREAMIKGATTAELRALPSGGLERVSDLWLQDAPKKNELTAVALALSPGAVSQPLPVPAGFAILRAEERAPARQRPLAEVRSGIIATLDEAARAQALSDIRRKLRSNARISVDERALSSYLAPAGRPPKVPGP